jgi:hypothetical protein
MKSLRIAALAISLAVGQSACAYGGQNQHIVSGADAVALRSHQLRAFDTEDRALVLRAVVATLQDLAFVVDEADEMLGVVSGTRLSGVPIRISVVVRSRGSRLVVRASAHRGLEAIETGEPDRDFFAALEKSPFLAGQQVD